MQWMWLLMLSLFVCSGCAQTVEVAKTVWGSSTRALEEARASAISKTYDQGYWKCMQALLAAIDRHKYVVFQKDEIKGYVVVMGIHGSVNTTEVGIFIVEINDNQARIEVSSLSTNAKRIVSKAIFKDIDVTFGLAAAESLEKIEEDVTDVKDASK